jgi:hypothetical protein
MISKEEIQKFLLMPPLHLVVVLDSVRLIRSALRRRTLRQQRRRGRKREHKGKNCEKSLMHNASTEMLVDILP